MDTRFCYRCSREKPLEDFYRDKTKKFGVGHRCKECERLYQRERSKRSSKIEQVAQWHQSEHGQEKDRASRRRRYILYKDKARAMIKKLIAQGVIQRQPCRECGEIKSQAHHPNYSEPLEVVWLCQVHHYEHHRINHSPSPE